MSILSLCGTVRPTTDAVLDAVREAKGRRAIRPAGTVEGAVLEVGEVGSRSFGQTCSKTATPKVTEYTLQ